MRAAGPAPAASRPALANDASSPLPDRVLWLAAATLPAAVSVLNYLALLACAALLLAALRELVRPWVGMAITAALLAQGPLVVSSVGGMETVFLCVLYLVTFLALLRQRYLLAGLAAGG